MGIITQQQIDNGAVEIAEKENIAVDALEYVGPMDCSAVKKGKTLLCYNILDAAHGKFQSTVTAVLFI